MRKKIIKLQTECFMNHPLGLSQFRTSKVPWCTEFAKIDTEKC